jgi:hypothetical protein
LIALGGNNNNEEYVDNDRESINTNELTDLYNSDGGG